MGRKMSKTRSLTSIGTTVACLVIMLSALILMVDAVQAETVGEPQETIAAFAELTPAIATQKMQVGSDQPPNLPTDLIATVKKQDGTVEENRSIPVTWTCTPKFNHNEAGVYEYLPVLPIEYQVEQQVPLPQIKVTVAKIKTTINGFGKTYTPKSRTSLKDKVTISPAFKRTMKLQRYEKGKWVTTKTYRLSNTLKDTLTVTFPNQWWKESSSKWRIHMDATNQGTSLSTPSATITTKRYYQNPSKYFQIKNEINLKHSGGYNLSVGYMGLKVRRVNSYFHTGNRYWPRYTTSTKGKVRAFQQRKKIKATGVVNKETWLKMGFSESSWYNLGAYVSPLKVNPSSSKKDHIEAMISTAYKYLGADYIVGASGAPSQGADCSGLVMQGLYAAGVDPYPVSSVRHSKPGYEYESRNLWASSKLKRVSYSNRKRGDLIFYRGRSGAVNHIAIYLGNNKVIESWPNKVVIWPIKNSHRSNVLGVKRVFN